MNEDPHNRLSQLLGTITEEMTATPTSHPATGATDVGSGETSKHNGQPNFDASSRFFLHNLLKTTRRRPTRELSSSPI